MPGTKIGGINAAKTNKKKYGSDFYRKIGVLGGLKSKGGGFAANPELAREAGRKGGKASRRTAIKQVEAEAQQTEKQHKSWKASKGL